MTSYDVLLVHPDPEVREHLSRALARDTDVGEVAVREAPDGLAEHLRELSPAIVFVAYAFYQEVQAARRIALSNGLPITVFVGAESRAVGAPFTCLAEPLEPGELETALVLAKEKVQLQEARRVIEELDAYIRSVRDPEDPYAQRAPLKTHFVVRARGRVVLVSEDDVNWISAERNYVRLHTDERDYLVRSTMQEVEERLAGHGFVRIHRSTIVRLSYLKEIVTGSSGYEAVRLKDGTKRSLSPAGRERLERELGRKL